MKTLFQKSDDKIEIRAPKSLKAQLKKESTDKGFQNLSQYLLSIILERKVSK